MTEALERLRKRVDEGKQNEVNWHTVSHQDLVEVIELVDASLEAERLICDEHDRALAEASWRGGVVALDGLIEGFKRSGVDFDVVTAIYGVRQDLEREGERRRVDGD